MSGKSSSSCEGREWGMRSVLFLFYLELVVFSVLQAKCSVRNLLFSKTNYLSVLCLPYLVTPSYPSPLRKTQQHTRISYKVRKGIGAKNSDINGWVILNYPSGVDTYRELKITVSVRPLWSGLFTQWVPSEIKCWFFIDFDWYT